MMFEAFITNLGRYNESYLDGAYLKLPAERKPLCSDACKEAAKRGWQREYIRRRGAMWTFRLSKTLANRGFPRPETG